MRAVHVFKSDGHLKTSEMFQNQMRNNCVSRFKHAVYARVILTTEGLFPAIRYPEIPVHKGPATIDMTDKGVMEWRAPQGVAVGWHGGHCGHCALHIVVKLLVKIVVGSR